MKQIWSICAVVLATCALNSVAQSSKYNVGFENPLYSVGDSYGQSTQGDDWSVVWAQGMDGVNAQISSNARNSGQRSLKIGYPKGAQDLKQALWALSGEKMYYLQYKVLFADNFEFNGNETQITGTGTANGGKLPGLAGRGTIEPRDPCGGGETCYTGRGFTARMMWRTDGVGALYLYDLTKTVKYGESFVYSGNRKFKRGAWNTITEKVTVNDPGTSNGSIQVWLDGQKVVDVKDRKLVGAGEQVDTVFFSTFFGGNDSRYFPTKQETAFFDGFIVSTKASDVGL